MDVMLKFRLLTPTDFERAIVVITEAFGESWEQIAIDEFEIVNSSAYYRPYFYGAFENNILVGAIATMRSGFMVDCRSISWVCVTPSKQRQGIGKYLINNLIETIKPEFKNSRGTFLLASQPHNIGYYEALGFVRGAPTHNGGILLTHITC